MEHFTPLSAAIGGTLIGLSAALLWLTNGRITGISGIIGSMWTAGTGDLAWRAAFIAGLIAAPMLYALSGGALPHIVFFLSRRRSSSPPDYWSASALASAAVAPAGTASVGWRDCRRAR